MAKKPLLKCLALALCLVVLLGLFTGCAESVSEILAQKPEAWAKPTGEKITDAKEEYVVVAESDTYKLWYYEPTFSIRLENKVTGNIMDSTVSQEVIDSHPEDKINKSWLGQMKSGIVIFAIKGTVNTHQVDLVTVKNTVTTYKLQNGLCAVISFPSFGFTLAVEVKLEGDELVVRVPDGSIQESKTEDPKNPTYISTIALFPMMGYSYLGEKDGYMLIPDGNGALIYLNDKDGRYSSGFSRLIYGNDAGFTAGGVTSYLWDDYETVTSPNNVIAPIFGMAHLSCGAAYLSIVESGDERCSINGIPNGVQIPYNRCYARFLLRDIYDQPLSNSETGKAIKVVETDRLHADLQVRYCLLSGEEANYSGMANAYRSYLLDNGVVSKLDTSYNTRVDLLGSDREEFLMGTTAVTMTTVDHAREIFEQLRAAGVKDVLSVYKGWQDGGVYSLPITGYKADSTIGGTGALTDLITQQSQQGYDLYLYDNALTVNGGTTAFTFDVMKMVNKRTFKIETRDQVYDLFYYLLPSKAGTNLQKLAQKMAAQGVQNLAVAGISDKLFSYSSKGSFYTRADTRAAFTQALETTGQIASLVLESPNAYMWKYTKAFLDMPLGSSDYLYVDQDIPFLSMVLKGIMPMYSQYVNFEANKTENFLQMVESGIYPSFYLTWESTSDLLYTNSGDLYSLEFTTYRDTVVEYDAALRALAEKTGGAHIILHETLQTGVVKVSYDNGVVIYVNYTEEAVTVDGVSVDALSYKVGEQA